MFHALCQSNYFSCQFTDAKKSWVVQGVRFKSSYLLLLHQTFPSVPILSVTATVTEACHKACPMKNHCPKAQVLVLPLSSNHQVFALPLYHSLSGSHGWAHVTVRAGRQEELVLQVGRREEAAAGRESMTVPQLPLSILGGFGYFPSAPPVLGLPLALSLIPVSPTPLPSCQFQAALKPLTPFQS